MRLRVNPEHYDDGTGDVFRICFWKALLYTIYFSIPLALVTLLYVEGFRVTFSGLVLLLEACVFGAVLGAVFLALGTRLLPYRLNRSGIYGYNCWGWPQSLSWSHIDHVRLIRVFGLPHLRLTGRSRWHVVWLPLFVDDVEGLSAALIRYTEASSPLGQLVRETGTITQSQPGQMPVRIVYH